MNMSWRAPWNKHPSHCSDVLSTSLMPPLPIGPSKGSCRVSPYAFWPCSGCMMTSSIWLSTAPPPVEEACQAPQTCSYWEEYAKVLRALIRVDFGHIVPVKIEMEVLRVKVVMLHKCEEPVAFHILGSSPQVREGSIIVMILQTKASLAISAEYDNKGISLYKRKTKDTTLTARLFRVRKPICWSMFPTTCFTRACYPPVSYYPLQ